MPTPPKSPAPRPLLDRLLERIRDNRVAAVVILASMVIGGAASLGDAVRKLSELLPGRAAASVSGEWKTGPADFYPAGPETLRLNLQEGPAGQVLGTLTFSGNDDIRARQFDVLDGRRDGRTLSLRLDSGAFVIASAGKTTALKESIVGEVEGQTLRLVYQRDGHGGVAVTARPLPLAAQQVAGRLALTFQGKAYTDHRAACEQLLRTLDPPHAYKLSEPPTEQGDVHCVGTLPDGRVSFDMYGAGIRLELVCPPDSRRFPNLAPNDRRLDRCECDGELRAVNGACVAVR